MDMVYVMKISRLFLSVMQQVRSIQSITSTAFLHWDFGEKRCIASLPLRMLFCVQRQMRQIPAGKSISGVVKRNT